MKSKIGMQSKKCPVSRHEKNDLDFTNELNLLYIRLNVHDFSDELSVFTNVSSMQNSVHSGRNLVLRLLRSLNVRKSPGPGGIRGCLLKNCTEQLASIFCFIFT